jgi:(E)-4-hydroxy-3-methylbut-2-enyl-diphosphate synthase
MMKVKTADSEAVVRGIQKLEAAGCEIVRLAVKDDSDAAALKHIKPYASIPLVADIHFDWRLAIKAIENGVDKIRLNPGNIYKKDEIRSVVRAAQSHHVPIRVGLNSGSLQRIKSAKRNIRNTAEAMVSGALEYIRFLERLHFYNIVISLKASSIGETIEAYRGIRRRCDYPLHLGVTATGASYSGAIKSSIALGILLYEGIGDTIRVSLTDTPEQEIKTAKAILEALGLRHFGVQIISCPTCGRCEVDLIKIVNGLDTRLAACGSIASPARKVAVMGCVVNGPGEAKEADIGIAFGKKEGLLFKKGRALRKVSASGSIDALIREIRKKKS